MAATATAIGDKKRRRTGINPIDDRKKRDVTFSKRKTGLFKKSAKLCASQPSAQVAVLVFSQTGNLFSFANPDIDTVINRYVDSNHGGVGDSGDDNLGFNNGGVVDSGGGDHGFWWDRVNVDDLGSLEDLQGFKKCLQEVKNRAIDRIGTILSNVELDNSDVGTATTTSNSTIWDNGSTSKSVDTAAISYTSAWDYGSTSKSVDNAATSNYSTWDNGSTSKSVDSCGSELKQDVFDHDFSEGGFLSLDDLDDDLKHWEPSSDVFSLEELGLF